ncbi:hypothetical protein [Parvularcula dongshanensis]|uniref:Uncharacterized protein n=1 Tax=Parvularcula dongshanensis TaxID=1173995 RepID=A0A840I3D0_9PROT|nr:hypothetical protein [Parvularcula dongshanensis]MBB4658714.1 hypothetical protein [Parvularcula dongshanensis]
MSNFEAVMPEAHGKFLMIDESHGTREGPEALYRYVCNLTSRGEKVIVGLEIEAHQDDTLQRGFQSEDPVEVWGEGLWIFDTQLSSFGDGRGSCAMMSLLLRFRDLQRAGADLEVRAVAGDSDSVASPRIAALPDMQSRRFAYDAYNLLQVSDDYEHVIFYAGGLHARRAGAQVDEDGPLFDRSRYLRLAPVIDGGFAQNCTLGHGCGTNPIERSTLRPSKVLNEHYEVGMDADMGPYFDGYIYLGETTASPRYLFTAGLSSCR